MTNDRRLRRVLLGRVLGLTACAFLFAGCGSESLTRSDSAQLRLELIANRQDDPRTYSIGRVQLRALDAQEMAMAAARLATLDADSDACVGFNEVQPPPPTPPTWPRP